MSSPFDTSVVSSVAGSLDEFSLVGMGATSSSEGAPPDLTPAFDSKDALDELLGNLLGIMHWWSETNWKLSVIFGQCCDFVGILFYF